MITNNSVQAALRLLLRAIADGDLESSRGRRILARAQAAMTVSRRDRPATARASRAEQVKDARLRRALALPSIAKDAPEMAAAA